MSAARERRCCTCKEILSVEEFYPRAKRCKACDKTATRNAATRRKERMLADPVYAAKVRAWGRDCRRRARDEKYGLEPGTVDRMFAEQDGRCKICRRTADEVGAKGRNGERLHVDQNHVTGEVRGLLCKKCNSAIGLMGDDPQLLAAAVDYLAPAMYLVRVG